MKKNILKGILLITSVICAQKGNNAPWMKQFESSATTSPQTGLTNTSYSRIKKNPTFKEIQNAFNTYWETHDEKAKGSGYKPFKRYEKIWADRVDTNGNLPEGQQLFEAWKHHQSFNQQLSGNDQSNWYPKGPFNYTQANAQPAGMGRLNNICVDPNNASTWYVGSPGGGVWRTRDAGSTWAPLSDNIPRVGVSAIAVDYNDSNTIYIATGDDDLGYSWTAGIFKSTDGGTTWQGTSLDVSQLTEFSYLSELFIDPTDSNKLICSSSGGVFISKDAGATWTHTLTAINIRDMRLKPRDAQTVYAVSPTAFYRSTDGGENFTQITNGVPTNTFRMTIDVTPANPNYVYIFSSDADDNRAHGIYRSTDSGQSFSTRDTGSFSLIGNDQVWYNMAIGVSDINPEEVYVGTMDVWRSANGGSTWDKLNRWDRLSPTYTHADIHCLRSHNGRMFCMSDGGIYSTSNNGITFEDHSNGLQIGEFFNVAVAKGNASNISGGLQDNGGFGIGVGGEWRGYHPGDGINTLITPNDDNTYYGLIQNGGTLYISNRGDGHYERVYRPSNAGNGVWVVPMAADSNDDVYAAWTNLFKLNKNNASWELVGSLNGYTDILEIAPSDPTRIYASGHQNLRRSSDGGQTLDFDTNVVGNAIAGIAIHPHDPDTLWITTDGDYDNKGIFKSTDGGVTWANITGNFPNDEFAEDIVFQDNHPLNPIFVSTHLGVYRLDDSSPDWQPFMKGLPNTDITDLELNLQDESITAATYGRGVWRSSIPVQLLPDDISVVAILSPENDSTICGDVYPKIRIRSNGINDINTATITYGAGGVTNAYIWNGSLSSNEEVEIDLPGFAMPSGNYTLTITASITNDGNNLNNTKSQPFTINASGSLNDIYTFEEAEDTFIITNNVWQRGVPTGNRLNTIASGTQAYGTNLSGNYPSNADAYLQSHCYDFTTISDPVLKFKMAYDLEQNWDFGTVEYSLNSGDSWAILGTTSSQPNWYNSSRKNGNVNGDCNECPGKQWTGRNTTMTEYAYDFAANAVIGEQDLTGEDNIVFRFRIKSDGVMNWEGMVIDDFSIEGTPNEIKVNPKAYLLGAALNPINGEEGLMRDTLRNENNIPTTSPYDMTTCESSVFGTTGTNAIVDWVEVELRDASDRSKKIASQSALLQRDGDIIAADGISSLSFQLPNDSYYILVKHRNHLAILSATTYELSNTTTLVDLSIDSSNVYGASNAVIQLPNGTYAMYAGDADANGQTQNSDISILSAALGSSGYLNGDMDMNGQVQNSDISTIVVPCIGKSVQF